MKFLNDAKRATWLLKVLGAWKIPILFWCRPSVTALDDEHCIIKIPLTRQTKNHENCMYIAALTVGADISGGLIAAYALHEQGLKASYLFKSMNAQYLKRAEGDVYFHCNDGKVLLQAIEDSKVKGCRINTNVQVEARVPSKLGESPAAVFTLCFSVRVKDGQVGVNDHKTSNESALS
jgi:hypothetical protein